MPERLERFGFIFTGIIHVIAIIWWVSTLSSNVTRQDELTRSLDTKVEAITEKVIRLEERTLTLRIKQERMDSEFKEILTRIERSLNGNNLQ